MQLPPMLLKFWLFLVCAILCTANPRGLVIDEDLRQEVIRMESEEVEMRIDRDLSHITGTYVFSQPNPARRSEAAAVKILLPVYVDHWIDPRTFAELNAIYTPVISVGGTIYVPQTVQTAVPSWRSFWRGAEFFRAEFVFNLPAEAMAEKFVINATYKQPHMVARKKKYACYCPVLPAIDYRDLLSSGPFTLRAIANEKLKLKRVSKNKSIISESAQQIEVNCIDREEIVIVTAPESLTK
jgi:hypothetical protein